jgi:enoyl-[acyl-carrier protein] reductase I
MGILDGKKILVAGVANDKSIAWGIARALRAHGAELAFSCLESNVRRLNKLAPQVDSDFIIPCNVQKDEDIVSTFKAIEARWGRLDGMVHSLAFANIDDLGGDFVNTSRAGWALAMDVSAYSLVAMARAARPLMKTAGGGTIVTLTFLGGERVCPGYNVMGIAKAALDMSVRYLAYYLGPDGIRINNISSAPVRTISAGAVEGIEDGFKAMNEKSPLRRNITTEDVGGTAVYLMSDLSRAVTAELIHVDCGISVMNP